jgi:uncharacterized protein YegL
MFLEDQIAINEDNPEPRCACALLLDTSGSMDGERIAELNAGLAALRDEIMTDDLARLRVELGVITFDSNVTVVRDFAPVADFEPPVLTAQNQTFTGTAILTALAKLEARKAYYKQEGLPYFRPWLFLITDGKPEGEGPEKLQEAKERLALAQNNKHLKVFAVGVGDNVDLDEIGGGDGDEGRPPQGHFLQGDVRLALRKHEEGFFVETRHGGQAFVD